MKQKEKLSQMTWQDFKSGEKRNIPQLLCKYLSWSEEKFLEWLAKNYVKWKDEPFSDFLLRWKEERSSNVSRVSKKIRGTFIILNVHIVQFKVIWSEKKLTSKGIYFAILGVNGCSYEIKLEIKGNCDFPFMNGLWFLVGWNTSIFIELM